MVYSGEDLEAATYSCYQLDGESPEDSFENIPLIQLCTPPKSAPLK